MSDEFIVVDGLRIRKSALPSITRTKGGVRAPRKDKLDRWWRDHYAHERANLMRECGIIDPEEIKRLVDSPNAPEAVRVFIIKRNLEEKARQEEDRLRAEATKEAHIGGVTFG